jgi:hypothetical protein
MYIGGMQMTPAPRYAPPRTDEPPGTIRTPLAAVRPPFIGSVSFSKKDHLAAVDAHVHHVTAAETNENALLHPDVDAPAGRRRRVGFGGA